MKSFTDTVTEYYRAHGRHNLPWRMTTDPYAIAVSEIMLQQTQVSRVIEKYRQFMEEFPTARALSRAPLARVLSMWNGLGYNRRAKFLHQMACVVESDHGGIFPATVEGLRQLPGIGAYTAGAIAAFAYDVPSVFIETNIRTVHVHHFFQKEYQGGVAVRDADIAEVVARTLGQRGTISAREWYWALMDYGAHLKRLGIKNGPCDHRPKQSVFQGSDRQVRGAIIRALAMGGDSATLTPRKAAAIAAAHKRDRDAMDAILAGLRVEGLIAKKGQSYTLA